MVSNKDILRSAIEKLETAGIDDPAFEAGQLLGKLIGLDPNSGEFMTALDRAAELSAAKGLDELSDRRISGEPLQYILGEWEFYGVPIKVGEGVLIPRQDTETLVDITLAKWRGKKDLTVIDLCSGSGCIAIALAKYLDCKAIYCVEKSEKAARYLRENLEINGVPAEVVMADVTDPGTLGKLPDADIIVCNPPYLTAEDMRSLQKEVSHEPYEALYGGEDGLDFYRVITRLWKDKLADSGMLCFEIGADQEDDVMMMMIQHGLRDVRCREDLCAIVRCVFGFKG